MLKIPTMIGNLNVLILTDHSRHSSENSLYALATEFLAHDQVEQVTVASRGITANRDFFALKENAKLYATVIDQSFAFDEINHPLDADFAEIDIAEYDLVFLRLPPPLDEPMVQYLSTVFSQQVVVNNPNGIHEVGSKAFLLNFPELCPPMQLCRSLDAIRAFARQFPVVLKPLREYGGKGIVKVDGDMVFKGDVEIPWEAFSQEIQSQDIEYLAVQFLTNVSQGDKRIIVVNGQVLGASLRLPKEGSWMCNVSMGGSSNATKITEEEYDIVRKINPLLLQNGIVMYGVDTLVGNDGKRILSEINATSIGGLPQAGRLSGTPVVPMAVTNIIKYYNQQTKNR